MDCNSIKRLNVMAFGEEVEVMGKYGGCIDYK